MSYVILDLEFNGSYSKSQHKFVNEIIEFGAVKTNDEFNITDRFSVLVSPKIGKKLSKMVKELTGLTIDELKENGIEFTQAVKEFTAFAGDSVIVTWSTTDIHALIENYSYYTGCLSLPFLKRYCNMQEYCESCLNLNDDSSQLGLSACAQLLDIEFSEEDHHRAFADAELSLKCLKRLVGRFSIDDFVQNADVSSFYEKMMFKNHFITNINNPDVDKTKMVFDCAECGKSIKRTSRWKLHNKAFRAEFLCNNCKKRYVGRVSFKRKYDEVCVKKKLTEKKQEQNKEQDLCAKA